MLKALRDHYLRVDARSLGLFRLAFGAVLIADLFRRWRWLTAFYSNDGVLPNHNHLFNLRETGQVWSALHAFSTPGENHFAFAVILLIYIAFLVGWNTRVFHALAIVGLVSLTGRNILLENAGNYAAIALLAFTLFLPCGSRFSLDSLRASLRLEDEHSDRDLNRRNAPNEALVNDMRLPGFSPVSLAALALFIQIAVIFFCLAYQHDSQPWKDGSALYNALHVERWTSGLGLGLRKLPFGLLKGYSYLLHAAEWAIVPLLFVPVMRGPTRALAAGLIAFCGLTYGLFFSFGLFGWSLAAASLLVISSESWDAFQRSWSPRRARTIIYDADCGICLMICRILKRMDLRGHLKFQGNTDIEEVIAPSPPGKSELIKRPAALAPEAVLETVVALDKDSHVFTRSRAVAEAIQALPLGWAFAWILRVPGISHAANALYNRVAARRTDISGLLGLGACGITPPSEAAEEAPTEAPPARRTLNFITGAIRDLCVLAILAAMITQTAQENRLPSPLSKIAQPSALGSIAHWPRMIARWNILTDGPAPEDTAFILDGQTKGGKSVDPLTGREPAFDPAQRRGAQLGQLWSDYLERLHQKEWNSFQKAFRDYIAKGGPAWTPEPPENQIVGFDAYWVTTPIPPPGAASSDAQPTREKIFTHSRGGRAAVEKPQLQIRPDLRTQ